MNIERVIELSTEIKLHREKAEELESQLRKEVSAIPDAATTTPSKTVNGNYVPKIIALLDASPDRIFQVDEVVTGVGGGNANSIRAACSRMTKSNQIRKAKPRGYQSVKVQLDLPQSRDTEVYKR